MGFEIRLIHFVQQMHSPFTEQLFFYLTALVEEDFLFIMFLLAFWLFSKRHAVQGFFVYVFSLGLNYVLKTIISRPRPVDVDGTIVDLKPSYGYAMPSGHTQSASTVAAILGLSILDNKQFRTKKFIIWFCVGLLLFSLMIGFTRIYLGQHYLSDILVAIPLGVAFAWVGHFGLSKIKENIFRYVSLAVGVLVLLVVLPLSIWVLRVSDFIVVKTAGLFMAATLGYYLDYILETKIKHKKPCAFVEKHRPYFVGLLLGLGISFYIAIMWVIGNFVATPVWVFVAVFGGAFVPLVLVSLFMRMCGFGGFRK
ncbi:MAG: phosphatase PAP2 family protein [Firmicutes bacterium]|nr:phosphatase PAP2 family protein [Bacillota bacterium]